MDFFIYDLHHQTPDLDKTEVQQWQSTLLSLYRGQGLSIEDFSELQSNKGGLISFNSFMSISKQRETSFMFPESSLNAVNTVGVLFQMSINPSTSSALYANIEGITNFLEEPETFFCMHAVFQIDDIRKLDENPLIYQAELELTSGDDAEFRQLTSHIGEETASYAEWHRLRYRLLKLDHFNQSENNY